MKIKDYMPEFKIEQNPLTSIIELITQLRRNNSETNNNPRDSSGRYAAPPEIEEATTQIEEIDVID